MRGRGQHHGGRRPLTSEEKKLVVDTICMIAVPCLVAGIFIMCLLLFT